MIMFKFSQFGVGREEVPALKMRKECIGKHCIDDVLTHIHESIAVLRANHQTHDFLSTRPN